jgi:monoamine oxidase
VARVGAERARADVVVVGAGLAGLSAAWLLVAAGLEVTVLEARRRVGGRTLTGRAADGTVLDLGAQWLGPTQDRIAALAGSVGVTSFPSFDRGDYLVLRDGRRRRAGGLFDGDEELAAAVSGAWEALDEAAVQVPLDAPWTAGEAARWDAQTAESWILAQTGSEPARELLRMSIRGTHAIEPREVSLLHVLFHLHAAGGLRKVVATSGGAQDSRFREGAQAVSTRLADRLGDRVVLGAAVREVEQDGAGVRLEAGGRTVGARRAILALPPTLAGRIAYRPAMPGWRDQLTQRVPMGSVIKVHAVYDEPFWRADGLSGQVVADAGAVRFTYDNSPESGRPGVLVAFVEGEDARRLGRQDPAERRALVLAELAGHLGARAGRPRELVERVWADEEHSGGCYAGYFPPGVWTSYGAALRVPVGRLHWAGTETATVWAGYMDGAVRSGERAAAEVLAALD